MQQSTTQQVLHRDEAWLRKHWREYEKKQF